MVLTLGVSLASVPLAAQMEDVEIQTVPVADGIYMLIGSGGNIGLSVGEDGAFIVDDQFAPLTEKINAAIAAVTEHPVKFVVNTHWHADHTGGNENYGQAGALIVAHENVRDRMSVEQYLEAFDSRTPPGASRRLTSPDVQRRSEFLLERRQHPRLSRRPGAYRR